MLNSDLIEKIMNKYLTFEENISDVEKRKLEAAKGLRSLSGEDLDRAVNSVGSRENYVEFIRSELSEFLVEGAAQGA